MDLSDDELLEEEEIPEAWKEYFVTTGNNSITTGFEKCILFSKVIAVVIILTLVLVYILRKVR